MAENSRKLEDLRDPYRNYNKLTIADLNKLTPLIDWNNLFLKTGFNNIDTVILGQPEYYQALNKALTTFDSTFYELL